MVITNAIDSSADAMLMANRELRGKNAAHCKQIYQQNKTVKNLQQQLSESNIDELNNSISQLEQQLLKSKTDLSISFEAIFGDDLQDDKGQDTSSLTEIVSTSLESPIASQNKSTANGT